MSKLKQLFYCAGWFFQTKLLGKRKPLQSVIYITGGKAPSADTSQGNSGGIGGGAAKPLSQILDELRYSYDQGSRLVDFRESSCSWADSSDEAKVLNQGQVADANTLIRKARELGFFSASIITYAQSPLITEANMVWVNIDGGSEQHDNLHGEGAFGRALKHVGLSEHQAVNVNTSINRNNYQDFEAIAQLVANTPQLKKMAFSFFTPIDGGDLSPSAEQRSLVIDQAIALKKSGFPLMNSLPALELMRDSQRYVNQSPCWITNFILANGTRLKECPGKEADVCNQCGFGMAAEMHLLWHLNPKVILGGLASR
ncbi:MAG: hypothetical protein FWD27_01745 [Coriobacteriia bacterium]|nr:hypothetical protein [Coriobacteriia bacterium]